MRFVPSNSMKIDLLPEQEAYLSTKDTICQVIRENPDSVFAFDILQDEILMGFALLHRFEPDSFFLWDYAIDWKFQNQGLGTEALKQLNMPLSVYHQCGQNHADTTQARYADAPEQLQVEVHPFIEDMAKAYSDADLIICRAGALTVTEIATAGVAAVFVPLPSAVDDHQTANAKFLANIGAAKICPQASMTPESLKELLLPLMNRQLLSEMAVKARQQAQPDATQHVVRLIQAL